VDDGEGLPRVTELIEVRLRPVADERVIPRRSSEGVAIEPAPLLSRQEFEVLTHDMHQRPPHVR
jgi:hypothetical protein